MATTAEAAAHTARAMREDGRRSGEHPELTAHRCDRHLQTLLWTLREPCGWTFEKISAEYNAALGASGIGVI
jgi:hypothetical protein